MAADDEDARASARHFVDRYRRLARREREELRATPVEVKLRQLCSLFASVDAMGWREALSEGDDEVRRRWQRLRQEVGSAC